MENARRSYRQGGGDKGLPEVHSRGIQGVDGEFRREDADFGRQHTMAAPELPGHFDIIIVGTGLVESMVAGACARAGKKVLHLDTHSYYGGRNSTFNLRSMCSWLRAEPPEDDFGGQPEPSEATAAMDSAATLDVMQASDEPAHVSFYHADAAASAEAEAALLPQSSRYNIDLNPQLLLCAGAMIDVLRASGVANYLEFKPMGAHLYVPASQAGTNPPALERVPCGKADIFQSSSISLVHKRQLMKFMQSCLALQQQLDAPPVSRAGSRGRSTLCESDSLSMRASACVPLHACIRSTALNLARVWAAMRFQPTHGRCHAKPQPRPTRPLRRWTRRVHCSAPASQSSRHGNVCPSRCATWRCTLSCSSHGRSPPPPMAPLLPTVCVAFVAT